MITRIFTLTLVGMLALAAISEACGRRGRGGCSGGSCGGGGCSSGGCAGGGCGSSYGYMPTSGCSSCSQGYIGATYPTMTGYTAGGCGRPGCICVGGNCPADCAANGCNCAVANSVSGLIASERTTGSATGLTLQSVCDAGRSCRLVNLPATSVPCAWKSVPNEPTQYAKYVNGAQVGAYDEQSMIFRTFSASSQAWGATTSYAAEQPKASPATSGTKPATGSTTPATGSTATPEAEAKATGAVIGTVAGTDLQDWQTRGVGWVPPKENTLWENGVKTLESQVMGGGSDVPDLSKRGRIVVVSNDAGKRRQIAKEIAGSPLGTTRDVQDFAPSAWQVKPFKLEQDPAFGQTDLVMLELGPVEADGRGGALHVEHTFGDIISFGRKIDPNFSIAGVPSSEQAGVGDATTTFIVIGVILAAVVFMVLPPKQTEIVVAAPTEQPEGVSPWGLT